MSDLIERLRNLNQHGFIKYDDLFIGSEAADELERLTKLNSQKNADIGDWAEKYAKKCNEAAALKRENEELRQKWLSPETYQTLMDERQELLHELAAVEAFKRRAIEVLCEESELAEELGYERFHRYAAEMKRKIEALPTGEE